MSPYFILTCFLIYTILLFIVSYITSKKSDNEAFFIGNKKSPWFVVAYGMIGASLSGVTFISIPGNVGNTQFSYMMIAFGYLLGYFIIASVLLPLYYRLNLTSIYSYLESRFGFWSHKTGAFYFILSRILGASLRMFLVVNVLQIFVFDAWGIPFTTTALIFIILIILYTLRGGVKTIIWTDTIQTTFMLLALAVSIFVITKSMGTDIKGIFSHVINSNFSKMIFTDFNDKNFYLKQFFSGAFIAIVMTGLDQEMMQKNISCKNLKDAQKNMYTFSFILVFVNFLFLFMGASMFLYAQHNNITLPVHSDDIFPVIAINYLGPVAGIAFIIGLISAAYPSADGALTSLTTSFSIDFLGMDKNTAMNKKKIRYMVHISFALLMMAAIIIFKAVNDRAVIEKLFTIASYTYGPLLGLYSFGLFTKYKVIDKYVPVITVLSPVICYILNTHSKQWLSGYNFGFELLIINGIITFAGLFLIRKTGTNKEQLISN